MTKRLAQGDDPLSVDLNTADFWGQLHQLPYGYANTGVATLLGNFIGAFLSYDSAVQGGECRGYVHIRVAVNVRLSFKRSKKVRAGNGAELVVQFRYERLPTFSFMCGKLGHSDRFCGLLFLKCREYRIHEDGAVGYVQTLGKAWVSPILFCDMKMAVLLWRLRLIFLGFLFLLGLISYDSESIKIYFSIYSWSLNTSFKNYFLFN